MRFVWLAHEDYRSSRVSYVPLLLSFVLWSLGLLSIVQAQDCNAILRSTTATLSSLQPCVVNWTGSPIVLDGSRTFSSPQGGPRQSLDLGFQQSILLIPPGAFLEITSADVTGLRIQPSLSVSLRLLAGIAVQPTATLHLQDVVLQTDCQTLSENQKWLKDNPLADVTLDASGDIIVESWASGRTTLTNCNITCARPTAIVSASPSPANPRDASGSSITPAAVNTTVLIRSDLHLYNAFALLSTYAPGSVTLVLAENVTTRIPLWSSQPLTLYRNVTISGRNSGGGAGAWAAWKPLLDFQDFTSGVWLRDQVVMTLEDLALVNAGMVFGYAPVAYTGLGFVPAFLWFFQFPRVVVSSTRPFIQLRVVRCDIVSYPEDIEHMSLWAMIVETPVPPLEKIAAASSVGVYDIHVVTARTAFNPTDLEGLRTVATSSTSLTLRHMEAFSMDYTNVSLVSGLSAAYNAAMMARRALVPLYKLDIPLGVSAVPVWTQADLQNALADAQGLTTCSPWTNITTYVHVFTNISLDYTKWPGFNISCNMNISGSMARPDGTWLNFNLLPRFITLTNKAKLTFRAMTLFNMPSQQRTYNLGDLTQMTLPLWPISRPPATSEYLTLMCCTIVLPVEEYRALSVTLAVSDDGYLSKALNACVNGFQLGPKSSRAVTISFFDGLNMTAVDTKFTDTSGYSSPLGPNIYGTANLYGASGGGGSKGEGGSGGLSSSAIIAIAIAVPLGCMALALAVWLLYLQRRNNAVRGSGSSRANLETKDLKTSPAPSDAGGDSLANAEAACGSPTVGGAASASKGGSVAATGADSITPGGSDGNSPSYGQSDKMDGQADVSNRDRSNIEMKNSGFDSDATPTAPPLHVELHQLILDFAREIEDKHLTIHDALGSGGFATVYRGTWRGIEVAVKIIEFQDRAAGNERLQARAMTEAAIAANIQHANIVTTYSYDIRPVQPNDPGLDTPSSSTLLGIGPSPEGGTMAAAGNLVRRRSGSSDQSGSASQAPRMWKLYLIQEFCEVGSLRVALENRMLQTSDGMPNMPMILRLALDVVRGLQHLHKKNIVHGDLTPGNILLKANLSRPGTYTGKLADFGLSVKMNPAQTSVDNNRTGTPFYASPEVRQHGNLTKASDLYALGVVLWEMWHGRPCYQRVRGVKHYIHAAGYPNFPLQCPPAFADLAGRCMRKPLEERPQLNEIHDTLRSLLGAAIGGLNSGSFASSDVGTSAGTSYEWPFVMQAPQDGVAGYGAAQGYDAGGGRTVSSGARGQAGGSSYRGGHGLGVAAANLPSPPDQAARPGLDIEGAIAAAGNLRGGVAWAEGAGVPAGGGTWPREGSGRSRLNPDLAGQHSIPQPTGPHPLQGLRNQREAKLAQLPLHQSDPSPQPRNAAPAGAQVPVPHHQQEGAASAPPALVQPSPALAALFTPLPTGGAGACVVDAGLEPPAAPALPSPPAVGFDAASLPAGTAQGCGLGLRLPPIQPGLGASGKGVPSGPSGGRAAPSLSISLNLPTADEFVSALGSKTAEE